MKASFNCLFITLCLVALMPLKKTMAQDYRVQIGAYINKVPFTNFLFAGIPNVYVNQDQNKIHRYYLINNFTTIQAAQKAIDELSERGFANAQIINIQKERSLCTQNDPAAQQGVIYTNINTEHLFFRNIYFDFNVSALSLESRKELNYIYDFLNNNPQLHVRIFGHTDALGSPDYNLRLSARRARAARNYLVAKGIHSKRIKLKVFGESTPIAINISEEGEDVPAGRKYNRRVVVAITDAFGEVIADQERMRDIPGHLRINKQILRQQLMYAELKK